MCIIHVDDRQNNGKLSDLNYCTTTAVITIITICDHGALQVDGSLHSTGLSASGARCSMLCLVNR